MAIKLVVTALFADFVVGQEITDPKLVAQYAASQSSFVVKVIADDPPLTVASPTKPEPDA